MPTMNTNKNNYLILDIETIPADDWERFLPDDLKQFPEFDLSTVKRLKKDTDEDYARKQIEAGIEFIAKFNEKKDAWLDKCSLRPLTGRVAVIGVNANGKIEQIYSDTETANITWLWNYCESAIKRGYDVIGFNIKKFDLPFLTLRGLKYGIKPAWHYDDKFNKQIKDIAEYFQQGNYGWKFPKCNDVFKYFGLDEKLADGSEFQKLWETDKQKALSYNKQELIQLEKVAKILYY